MKGGTTSSEVILSTRTRSVISTVLLQGLGAEFPKLLDAIESQLKEGGYIIDWHACDLFPESWIDLVVVLRTDSTQLYDRLKARDYSEAKLQENLDSEIMEVLLTEARESYDENVIVELKSNDNEDLDSNVERLETWLGSWRKNSKEDQS